MHVYQNVLGERKALLVKRISQFNCKMYPRVTGVCYVFFHWEQRKVEEYVY